jgi:hypothetical protein
MLINNGYGALYFLAEEILLCIHNKFPYRANYRGRYADGLNNSMIDDNDSHTPSPLILFTCTALRHTLLVWQ